MCEDQVVFKCCRVDTDGSLETHCGVRVALEREKSSSERLLIDDTALLVSKR